MGEQPNVVFAMMNEPNSMPTQLWANTAQAAMLAIRATGANQLVLVPGNGWTGAHSWLESWYDTSDDSLSNAAAFENFSDPADNFAFEMHQYLDSDASGSKEVCVSDTAGVDALSGATDWLESHGFRGFIGEFAGGATPCVLKLLIKCSHTWTTILCGWGGLGGPLDLGGEVPGQVWSPAVMERTNPRLNG